MGTNNSQIQMVWKPIITINGIQSPNTTNEYTESKQRKESTDCAQNKKKNAALWEHVLGITGARIAPFYSSRNLGKLYGLDHVKCCRHRIYQDGKNTSTANLEHTHNSQFLRQKLFGILPIECLRYPNLLSLPTCCELHPTSRREMPSRRAARCSMLSSIASLTTNLVAGVFVVASAAQRQTPTPTETGMIPTKWMAKQKPWWSSCKISSVRFLFRVFVSAPARMMLKWF